MAVVLPAGTTYRFGDSANNRWSAPVTVTEPTTFSPVSQNSGVFPFGDPDVGTVKELDVLETATPQTVLVTDLSVSPASSVSLTIPPSVPPSSVPMKPGTTYTLTFSSFMVAANSPQSPPMVALVNAPPSMAYQTWEGTQVNLTIDGVTLVCTPTQNNTDQSMSMNCAVPAAKDVTQTDPTQMAIAGQ
jgi:hypothetical protein